MIREIEKEEKVMSRNERQKLRREARREEARAKEEEEAQKNAASSTEQPIKMQKRPSFM